MTLLHGNNLDLLRAMPDNSVDAIVCDPPYGLGKEPDALAMLRDWIETGHHDVKSKSGFMGKTWDAFVPQPVQWRECLRVLKPGGHLLAFAGTRTQDLVALGLRLAGFEIRDLVAWVYGSGFPKSLDVGKALDKMAGAEREQVKPKSVINHQRQLGNHRPYMDDPNHTTDSDVPVTEAAKQWDGWGTALKPALEPLTLARKPLGSPAINVLKNVENGLRSRGVTTHIKWKKESASDVGEVSRQNNSSSTEARPAEEASVESADASAIGSDEQPTLKSSGTLGKHGISQDREGQMKSPEKAANACGIKHSKPMEGNALVAENQSNVFSPSTISPVAEPSTERPSTERCTPSSDERGSPMGTECFAGIATGLTGSMGTVHIKRDSNGAFLWPRDLPKEVSGQNLTVAANVLKWHTGALNVDGCRVGSEIVKVVGPAGGGRKFARKYDHNAENLPNVTLSEHTGRWPANLIHDGSDEVTGLFPESNGQLAASRSDGEDKTNLVYGKMQHNPKVMMPRDDGDNKSAARFFYAAKVSAKERNEGLEHLPDHDWQGDGAAVPERENRPFNPSKNHHPTVKPIALMRYLCRLITPPGGTVLDPWMGSGSTGKAAALEGFDFIGMEQDAGYFAIAQARCGVTPEAVEIDPYEL